MGTEQEIPRMPLKAHNRRVHMANERTFLAWIRTSIGLMAFGFVVEKFALFVRQISYFLQHSAGQAGGAAPAAPEMPGYLKPGYSSYLGVALVGLGVLMAMLALVRYKKVEKQIDEDSYQPSMILDMLLAISVLAIGVFLAIYLVHSL